MKKMRSENGAITIIVLVSVLFMVSFLIIILGANAVGLFIYKSVGIFTAVDAINVPATITANLAILLSAMVSTLCIIKETQIDKFLRGIND